MQKVFYLICIQLSILLLFCSCTQKETTKQGFEYYRTNGYNYTLKDGIEAAIKEEVEEVEEVVNVVD